MKAPLVYVETGKHEVVTVEVPDRYAPEIVAASPIMKQNSTIAFRVVLRFEVDPNGNKRFIVHQQGFPTPGNEIGVHFYEGNYFPIGKKPFVEVYKEAYAKFLRVCERQMSVVMDDD